MSDNARDRLNNDERAGHSANTPLNEKKREQARYEQWTRVELYAEARQLGIVNRSKMTKTQLARVLRTYRH